MITLATQEKFKLAEIDISNKRISRLKTLVETQFYLNNVEKVTTLQQAYDLSKAYPNTIILDKKIKHAKDLNLSEDTYILVDNAGSRVGRNAKVRRIFETADNAKLEQVVLDAMFDNAHRKFYQAEAVVGLHEDFMLKAHLLANENSINNLYSWLLNFQDFNEKYRDIYKNSKLLNENDIYVYCDSDWSHPDFPDGLSYFDPKANVICVLGMSYFGELKKGTLTLAWATAYRQGYVPCHGGLKIFKHNNQDYVASFFGLSGSGKSTLTHDKHDNKYEVLVLHDDAFIINLEDGSSIALEPAYFDKTQDYPPTHSETDYFLTVQNVGVTLDESGKKTLVTQDIRNVNGRTVKSRYATPNRVDKITEPINAIYWIMKDNSLPPLIKVNDPLLASTLGLTLATKRTTAEIGVSDRDALVIEPYANPFRVYNLNDDYTRFKQLFDKGIDCLLINTGDYLEQDITKEMTLSLIENEVENKNTFKPFFNSKSVEYATIDNMPLKKTAEALDLIKARIDVRIDYIKNHNITNEHDLIDEEAINALEKFKNELHL